MYTYEYVWGGKRRPVRQVQTDDTPTLCAQLPTVTVETGARVRMRGLHKGSAQCASSLPLGPYQDEPFIRKHVNSALADSAAQTKRKTQNNNAI